MIGLSKRPPSEVKEYVIRLQDKERQLLDDYVSSQMAANYGNLIDAIGLKKALSDPADAILWVTAIATIIEMFGYDTPIITPIDAGKLFKDPDGSTGVKGFWDVNLQRDIDRVKNWWPL